MRGLSEFMGGYEVSRTIKDARAGATSRFEGRAEISATSDGAEYVERGALIMNEQRFEAERKYIWRRAGERIEVLFEDGRAFHDFDPSLGGQATEHLCGEDMYRGGYDFSEWTCWAVTWNVQGPRKDYVSTTWYVRG
ncbi:MAG: DUF6314 family protein [Octadecabacter sp.]